LAWYEDQALTRTAPSAATDGIPLHDLQGVMVVVEANSAQTLSGAGSLRAYVYDPIVAAWFRVPALDLSVNSASIRRMGFESEQIAGLRRATRLDYATDSVTVSGGTTVRVYVLGGT
jgi:hypothetical protein